MKALEKKLDFIIKKQSELAITLSSISDEVQILKNESKSRDSKIVILENQLEEQKSRCDTIEPKLLEMEVKDRKLNLIIHGLSKEKQQQTVFANVSTLFSSTMEITDKVQILECYRMSQKSNVSTPPEISHRIINKKNLDCLKDKLNITDWSRVFDAEDVNSAMAHFFEKFNAAFDESCPREVSTRLAEVATSGEQNKLARHVLEVETITALLFGLAGRLARAQNVLASLGEDVGTSSPRTCLAKDFLSCKGRIKPGLWPFDYNTFFCAEFSAASILDSQLLDSHSQLAEPDQGADKTKEPSVVFSVTPES
ncbi:hypothetical protein QYM36_009761 [Artemia franciscana]|uniref:ASD2 domain-containing protein n=1 Tax=Artemia franciscana TaxID=6661 RepID=A0AA88L5Y4_ARTSF|nr:hypothetical protein QYM36_009761 [Artemia franciscana]